MAASSTYLIFVTYITCIVYIGGEKFAKWRSFSFPFLMIVQKSEISPPDKCGNVWSSGFFVVQSILLQFTHFCREIDFVAMWRKKTNIRYGCSLMDFDAKACNSLWSHCYLHLSSLILGISFHGAAQPNSCYDRKGPSAFLCLAPLWAFYGVSDVWQSHDRQMVGCQKLVSIWGRDPSVLLTISSSPMACFDAPSPYFLNDQ